MSVLQCSVDAAEITDDDDDCTDACDDDVHLSEWQCDNYNLKQYRRCKNVFRINLSGYINYMSTIFFNYI